MSYRLFRNNGRRNRNLYTTSARTSWELCVVNRMNDAERNTE